MERSREFVQQLLQEAERALAAIGPEADPLRAMASALATRTH
jgi:hypothetical protein